ncbi:MAG: MBL fold metallo-hydrolase [Candidatus Daviesbacteria bacterium]|nr:MBL fold metallo-hydrolase [Candidatus Daviesbacteria bacterium]
MEISWFGQSCFKIKGKNASVIIDPYDPEFTGLKLPKDMSSDVVLVSHGHKDHNFTVSSMVFDKPGEYEVGGVVITAISSFHDNSEGQERGVNNIFHLFFEGLDIVHLGDLGQSKLTEDQVAEIGQTDILMIPVGGTYTINSEAASEIISQLEPKIIIPMHYKIEDLKFELDGVDKFLKEMGAEGVVPLPKLSISKDKLPEEPQVVVLSKV